MLKVCSANFVPEPSKGSRINVVRRWC